MKIFMNLKQLLTTLQVKMDFECYWLDALNGSGLSVKEQENKTLKAVKIWERKWLRNVTVNLV
jgi:hypothetical protein